MFIWSNKTLKPMKAVLCIGLLFLTCNLHAQSICSPQEEIVFSCDTKTKIISICAAMSGNTQQKRIRYLFGTKKGKIELAYPARDDKSSKQHFASNYGYGPGFNSYISFRIGAFKYFVYSNHGDDAYSETGHKMAIAFDQAGVAIFKDSALVKHIKCSPGAQLSEEIINRYGFPREYDGLFWNSSLEP